MEHSITEFRGKWRFLSNFYPSLVNLDGWWYQTVEHAYQAAKTTKIEDRVPIYNVGSPAGAKSLGQKLSLRPDWENVKTDVMLLLLRQKFSHYSLRELLLSTGNAELVEGNTWGDTFWGVCNGKGSNFLGKLLMQVREEVRTNR
jgi:ribA/ribD-fused uncharacterized protein